MAFTPEDKAMLEGYIAKARPFKDMFSVEGKVALVTGGSSGLGFDITLRLLQGGARVVMASNSRIEEEAALDLLQKEGFGDKVAFCFTDVRHEEEVETLVKFTVEKFGSLDIFVNSAAIWNYAKIYDLPKEDLALIFETNVYGAFYGVKHVSRYMKENGIHGKMVLISSNSPIVPYPVFGGYPHYASSKAAVMGLVTEAAKELKRYGINVNSIAPGGMVTPGAAGNLASEGLTEEQQDEFYDELMVWQVDGQLPVDDVGIMAYTFCTPVADSITGETVLVDGGASHNIVKYQAAIDAYPPED
ncbi:MAG: SDR family oxidoreductase [Erysipelotrichaceae bacterium]|nr:SDR family oxidoreductase [Erysipelotrichaceae bacterium]